MSLLVQEPVWSPWLSVQGVNDSLSQCTEHWGKKMLEASRGFLAMVPWLPTGCCLWTALWEKLEQSISVLQGGKSSCSPFGFLIWVLFELVSLTSSTFLWISFLSWVWWLWPKDLADYFRSLGQELQNVYNISLFIKRSMSVCVCYLLKGYLGFKTRFWGPAVLL